MSQAATPTTGPYIARTADDLSQLMLDYLAMMDTGITDLNEGAVVRTEIEALAQLGQQFYADMATALPDAITQSAYAAFNFTPLQALPANGYLVVYVQQALSAPLQVVAGTLWQPSGQNVTYATTTTFTIPSATTGRWHVPATCLLPGVAGNLTGGATGDLQYPISGVTVYAEDGAVNTGDVVVPTGATPLAKGVIGGRDPETPVEMQTRFTKFLTSLQRSTLVALGYGAQTAVLTNPDGTIAEQVSLARAVDHSVDGVLVPSTGSVNIYIFNGVGSPGGLLTSSTLVTTAQNIINGTTSQGTFTPGYKAAGIPATVSAAGEYLVSLSITVTAVGSGTATAVPASVVSSTVLQAVQTYFAGLQIGQKFYLSGLTSAIGELTSTVQNVQVTALSIVRQSDSTVMTSTVGDYTTPTNGILLLASGQPGITVL